MDDMNTHIEKVLKHNYKELARLKKRLKEIEEIINIFEGLKRGDLYDRLQQNVD